MRVALVVGHHERSKGAFSPWLKTSEWDFYNDVVDCVNDVDVFFHDKSIGGYTKRITKTSAALDKGDYDLVMPLHFNSSSNSDANGCETLYFDGSSKGYEYAKLFSETLELWTGINIRRKDGTKALKKGDRGYAMVQMPKAPVILIEPFFGSNKKDCQLIETPELLSAIINDFLDKVSEW